jgi:Bacteriocin-protection, YdeI or OmpD-Associated
MKHEVYVLEKFANGMHCIMLSEAVVKSITKGDNKRAICKINNSLTFHCAIMPRKSGGHFIVIGSKIFEIDNTTYQFEMPEELKVVLEMDTEANRIFHTLTEGNQRGLMYLVTLVKSSDKRIERALLIAEKIKIGVTAPRLILKK